MDKEPVEFYERTPVLSVLRIGMGGRLYGTALHQLRMGMVVCPLVGNPSGEQCVA
jgi:hypothetical protein